MFFQNQQILTAQKTNLNVGKFNKKSFRWSGKSQDGMGNVTKQPNYITNE